MQESQTPHGVAVGPCSQFNERAKMRADDVFPQPRGPENRYAWLIRPAVQGNRQRFGDVLLAHHLGEGCRSILAVEGHGQH